MDKVKRIGRGITGATLVVMGCSIMAFFLHGAILPLLLLWPWGYRRLTEVCLSGGLTFLVAINEKIHGVDVRAYGDTIERHEKTVVIMNHRTRLDWMYFFNYLYYMKVLNRQKITLKSQIKWVPVLGWSLQAAGYIFLDRKAENDHANIEKSLTYYEELGCKSNILIFPEGTDLSPGNQERGWKYAEDRELAKYNYLLHPRIKGFVWYVQILRKVGGIQAVHDITVGYPDTIVCDEKEVLLGRLPKQVHFHVKRYSIDELPKDDEGLGEWIKQRWEEKEARLQKFYEQNSSDREFDGQYHPHDTLRSLFLWFIVAVWCCGGVFLAYLLLSSKWFVVYCAALVMFFIKVTKTYGSLAMLEMSMYEQYHKPHNKWAGKRN